VRNRIETLTTQLHTTKFEIAKIENEFEEKYTIHEEYRLSVQAYKQQNINDLREQRGEAEKRLAKTKEEQKWVESRRLMQAPPSEQAKSPPEVPVVDETLLLEERAKIVCAILDAFPESPTIYPHLLITLAHALEYTLPLPLHILGHITLHNRKIPLSTPIINFQLASILGDVLRRQVTPHDVKTTQQLMDKLRDPNAPRGDCQVSLAICLKVAGEFQEEVSTKSSGSKASLADWNLL